MLTQDILATKSLDELLALCDRVNAFTIDEAMKPAIIMPEGTTFSIEQWERAYCGIEMLMATISDASAYAWGDQEALRARLHAAKLYCETFPNEPLGTGHRAMFSSPWDFHFTNDPEAVAVTFQAFLLENDERHIDDTQENRDAIRDFCKMCIDTGIAKEKITNLIGMICAEDDDLATAMLPIIDQL